MKHVSRIPIECRTAGHAWMTSESGLFRICTHDYCLVQEQQVEGEWRDARPSPQSLANYARHLKREQAQGGHHS